MFHQLFVREVVVNYNWNYSKRVSSGPSHQRHRQQHWKAYRLRGVCIETMGSVDNMDYTMWIRTRKDVGRYWWMLCKESRVVPKAKETTFKPTDAPQGWQPTSTFGNQLRKRLQERLPDATTLLGVLNAAVPTMMPPSRCQACFDPLFSLKTVSFTARGFVLVTGLGIIPPRAPLRLRSLSLRRSDVLQWHLDNLLLVIPKLEVLRLVDMRSNSAWTQYRLSRLVQSLHDRSI